MADRGTLLMLEAIRLEIRAASESIANTVAGIPDTTSGRLKQRADALVPLALQGVGLSEVDRAALWPSRR